MCTIYGALCWNSQLSLTAWCICINRAINNSQSFSVIHIQHTDAQHCFECAVSNHTQQCNFQVQVDPVVYHSQCYWNIHICYQQNRLSFTQYSAYTFHYYHCPYIPVGRGSAMSLREPLVSGKFLAHLAHLFWKLLFIFVISSVSHSNFYFSKRIIFLITFFLHIFIIKGIFINLFIMHDGWIHLDMFIAHINTLVVSWMIIT